MRDKNIKVLLNVKFPITLRIGSKVLPLKDASNLNADNRIEFDQALGDSVELLINKTPVSRGKLVMYNGEPAYQVEEILSIEKLLKSLNSLENL